MAVEEEDTEVEHLRKLLNEKFMLTQDPADSKIQSEVSSQNKSSRRSKEHNKSPKLRTSNSSIEKFHFGTEYLPSGTPGSPKLHRSHPKLEQSQRRFSAEIPSSSSSSHSTKVDSKSRRRLSQTSSGKEFRHRGSLDASFYSRNIEYAMVPVQYQLVPIQKPPVAALPLNNSSYMHSIHHGTSNMQRIEPPVYRSYYDYKKHYRSSSMNVLQNMDDSDDEIPLADLKAKLTTHISATSLKKKSVVDEDSDDVPLAKIIAKKKSLQSSQGNKTSHNSRPQNSKTIHQVITEDDDDITPLALRPGWESLKKPKDK